MPDLKKNELTFLNRFLAINAYGTHVLVAKKRNALLKLIEVSKNPEDGKYWDESFDTSDLAISLKYRKALHNVIKADPFLRVIFPESTKVADGGEPTYIDLFKSGVLDVQNHVLKLYNECTENEQEYLRVVSEIANSDIKDSQDVLDQLKILTDTMSKFNIEVEESTEAEGMKARFVAAVEFEKELRELHNLVAKKNDKETSKYKNLHLDDASVLTRRPSVGSGVTSNMIVLPNDDGWTFEIYSGKNWKNLSPTATAPVISSLAFTKSSESENKFPVLVGLDEKDKEVIVGIRQFPLPNCKDGKSAGAVTVRLQQERDGSRVTSHVTVPKLEEITEEQRKKWENIQSEIAMKQAEMLLLNYKVGRGWDQITINEPDPDMSKKIHAALLLMIEDSPAKGISKIVNANSNVSRQESPDALKHKYFYKPWLGRASQYRSYIENNLGADIVEKYQQEKEEAMIVHTDTIQAIQLKSKVEHEEKHRSEEDYLEKEGYQLKI